MNVQEIIKRIAKLALNGDIVDDATQTSDVLGYINAVYRDISTSLLSETDSRNHKTSDYTVTNGLTTITPIPYKIFNVVDINTEKKLNLVNINRIEEVDPLISKAGEPDSYYFTQNTLKTYPSNDTKIRVRYVNTPQDLTLSSTEAEIAIPAAYHEILVWGALYYMAYDERDFQQALELQVTAGNFDSWKDRLSAYYYYNQYKPLQSPLEDF